MHVKNFEDDQCNERSTLSLKKKNLDAPVPWQITENLDYEHFETGTIWKLLHL